MRLLPFVLALAAAPAVAEVPQAIVPTGLEWQVKEYGFSPAVRAGDFIFVSGVVAGYATGEDGKPVAPTDAAIEAGFERAFVRLEEIIKAAGADWSDVVEMTTYHTDLPAQGRILMTVKAKRMNEPFPAWTAIDVDRLWPDNGFAEIRLTLYAPRK